MYPFDILVATCNCLNCQARTVFDSDIFKLSRCVPNYQLKPVLVRIENISFINHCEFMRIFPFKSVC